MPTVQSSILNLKIWNHRFRKQIAIPGSAGTRAQYL